LRQASIVFEDESGFMLEPVRRRTWAPRGHTPVQYAWDRHDRLSVVSAVTVSAAHRRIGLYFRVQRENVCAEDLVAFVRQLHRHVGRPIILVWDRSGPHRRAAKLLLAEQPKWMHIEWLPPYAPDLNPTEQCWNHSKNVDLGNLLADDTDELSVAVCKSFAKQRNNQPLLRSFFKTAKLKL